MSAAKEVLTRLKRAARAHAAIHRIELPTDEREWRQRLRDAAIRYVEALSACQVHQPPRDDNKHPLLVELVEAGHNLEQEAAVFTLALFVNSDAPDGGAS